METVDEINETIPALESEAVWNHAEPKHVWLTVVCLGTSMYCPEVNRSKGRKGK